MYFVLEKEWRETVKFFDQPISQAEVTKRTVILCFKFRFLLNINFDHPKIYKSHTAICFDRYGLMMTTWVVTVV